MDGFPCRRGMAVLAVGAAVGLAAAAGAAPEMSLSSSILQTLEREGTVVEAELDEGLWEIRLCDVAGPCEQRYLEPASGREIRRKAVRVKRRPPAGAMALSAIVRQLDADQSGRVVEVELERRGWEVKLRQPMQTVKLLVDPATGERRPLR